MIRWERLERDNHPPVGELVLVYGVADPATDGTSAEVSVARLTSPPFGFEEFEAVSHWCEFDNVDGPEGY